MENKQTELVFILDKSGSMEGLEKDTIGGYNAMLQKQKKEEGEVRVTTVLFNHEWETLHDGVVIDKVEDMSEADYKVSGMTALLDAVGMTIQQIQARQTEGNVLFVITTDGMENSSREFTVQKVKEMIQFQKENGWEFLFLGANIDAISEAEKFGIDRDFAVDYHADATGVRESFDAIHEVAMSFRQSGVVMEGWKEKIEEDYNSRQ